MLIRKLELLLYGLLLGVGCSILGCVLVYFLWLMVDLIRRF